MRRGALIPQARKADGGAPRLAFMGPSSFGMLRLCVLAHVLLPPAAASAGGLASLVCRRIGNDACGGRAESPAPSNSCGATPNQSSPTASTPPPRPRADLARGGPRRAACRTRWCWLRPAAAAAPLRRCEYLHTCKYIHCWPLENGARAARALPDPSGPALKPGHQEWPQPPPALRSFSTAWCRRRSPGDPWPAIRASTRYRTRTSAGRSA